MTEGHIIAVLFRLVTSHKVAGSIPDDVYGNFQLYNPSGRIMSLGLTQALTEMSNRNFLGVKRLVRRVDNDTTFMCTLS